MGGLSLGPCAGQAGKAGGVNPPPLSLAFLSPPGAGKKVAFPLMGVFCENLALGGILAQGSAEQMSTPIELLYMLVKLRHR